VLMMFVGTGDEDGASSLHDPRFLPSDVRVTEVARALVAGYLAAAGELTEPSGGPAPLAGGR